MRRNPVKKGNLTYGEAFDDLKKIREQEAKKKEELEVEKDSFENSMSGLADALMNGK